MAGHLSLNLQERRGISRGHKTLFILIFIALPIWGMSLRVGRGGEGVNVIEKGHI
jgi:hypothetical protein